MSAITKAIIKLIFSTILIPLGILVSLTHATYNYEILLRSILTLLLLIPGTVLFIAGSIGLIKAIIRAVKHSRTKSTQRTNEKTVSETLSDTDTYNELKKYHDMLDDNLITQEDYDTKKKQLLNIE